MYRHAEKLIYDNTYPVRFEGRKDAVLAIVSEDGCHFFAKWEMLRRPTISERKHRWAELVAKAAQSPAPWGKLTPTHEQE